MGKFCTSCGAALNEGAKSMFSEAAPAYRSAGELALPSELVPVTGDFAGEGLLSLLKSGFRGLAGGFKQTLGDKKRLGVVIALGVIWLLVNLLAALGLFPLPLRVLSWLTAAQGSLIGGSIGKGLVAALLAQMIADKGMLQSVKSSIGQLPAMAKGGKKSYALLLLGAGVALIACNLMVSSNLQNTMVCVAGFALSAKALTQNGFLRRLISSVMPKMYPAGISTVMQGWTAGFALFIAVCLIPGGSNGYIGGAAMLIAGMILMIVNNNQKEVTAE